jgi:hypothetical protein
MTAASGSPTKSVSTTASTDPSRNAEWRGAGNRRALRPGRPGPSVVSRLDRFVDKPATGKQLLGLAEELLGTKDPGYLTRDPR